MRSLKRITAVTLSAAMVAGLIAGPVTTAYAAESVEKEETVYVNQTATGDIKSITVSDWLKNVTGTGTIKDKSSLKDIKNVKGNEKFTESNGELTWEANDADIYYQGTTTEKPPVGVEISYKLDGKTVSADDLAGKSGNIEITLKYTNDTSYEDDIDGETTKLQSPFLMASAIIMPVDNFSDIEVSQGKVVSEGSNQILVAYGMPGLFDSLKLADDTREKLEDKLSDTVTIKAKVTDFEMGSIYTVATSDEFSEIELDENSDMDELEDALDELEDASEALVSGTSTLSEGIGTLEDNFKDYAAGVSKVSKGASSLSAGAKKLSTGITQYTDGVKTVTDGTKDYIKGTGSLTSGVKAYVAGEKQVADGVKKLYDGSKDFPTKYSAFSAGLNNYVTNVDKIADNANELAMGSAAVSTGVTDLVNGIAATSTEIQKLGKNEEAYTTGQLEKLSKYIDEHTYSDTNSEGTISPADAANLKGLLDNAQATATAEENILKGLEATADPSKLKDLDDGAKKIAAGLAVINAGAPDLKKGGATLIGYDKDISAGITSVTGGITGIYEGINKLSENNDALTTGADTLEKSGSLLTSGIGQLTTNTKSLTTGASDLSKGAKSLSTGAASLNTATGKVTDGIGKLSEGSDKLADGMDQFKTKGTDKIRNEYNNKVKTVLDRFDSLTGEAGQYNSFSGLADGMNGKVKFIFQTAEIKAED
ncbi:MAG: hypothetical protein IJ661_13055 [Lachnospiraceae bacterium]|nr:hypothetical protein [Lachnospiraceae bacterium]